MHTEQNTTTTTPAEEVHATQPETIGNAQPEKVTVSTEEFNLLQELIQERRTNIMKDRAKHHSKILSSRRITVALRRIDLKAIAPDPDVVAYIEVSNLRAVAGEKAEPTDDEISKYLILFNEGNDHPTLDQIRGARQ